MSRAFACHLTPAGSRRVSGVAAAVATSSAAAVVVLLPTTADGASIWTLATTAFPDSAASWFVLAVATLTGCVVTLGADAVAQRRALRPALTAVVAATLVAPAAVAAPLWPALLAAAALIALPRRDRPRAANDNPVPAHRAPHPFSLAA